MILNESRIIKKNKLSKDTYEVYFINHMDINNLKPGMFINISTMDGSMILRRPISICDYNNDYLRIIYRIMGDGLRKINELEYLNYLGPLGNGFDLKNNKNILIIGGGIGIFPLLGLIKRLKNCNITTILGFKNKESILLEEEFKIYSHKVFIATDDGSYGFKGNILEFLKINNFNFDYVYACGPKIVLKGIDNLYKDKKGFLSLEEYMACGIGTCMGCVINTKNGLKRVCKDGPIFKLGEILWD